MKKLLMFVCWATLPALGVSQGLKLDGLDRLAAKASDTVTVNLDGSLLRLASRFLSSNDPDEAQVKKLVAGLTSIQVRSFEFKSTGAYVEADVEAIRSQLKDPKWKRIVEVRSNRNEGDNADVYLRQDGDRITGLTVISSEPRELTIVCIDGSIDPEGLRALSGNFGIPSSLGRKLEKKTK